METIFQFYPEFSKELKAHSCASFLYGEIIKQSEKNFKAVKNLACEASSEWFAQKLGFSTKSMRSCLKELSEKAFIRIEELNKNNRSYKDGCHINRKYIPLILPASLRDKYKEVI